MAYTIRPACEGDIPAIAAIYAEAVAHGTASFELTIPDEAEMKNRMLDITGKGYPYLIMEKGSCFVGYAYAGAYRARPAYRWTVENSIYLDEGMRGQGYGKSLLMELIEICAALDFRQMVSIIGDSENCASVALHEGCGFHMTGTFTDVGWKHGRWLDSVMMQRELGLGSLSSPLQEGVPARLFTGAGI
jgi:L-amino acid N-acyltransferase YncA